MKKAVWEKKLINSYRLKIKTLIKNEKDEYLLCSYYNDLAILDALEEYQIDGRCFIQSDDFSKKSLQDVSCLTQFEEFYDDIQTFERKRNLIPGFEVGNIATIKNTREDILAFVFDFFQQFDKNYSRILNKIYNSNRNNIIFSKHRSVTFSLSHNQGYFINVEKNNSIEEYINGVHEFSHAIADYIKLRYYTSSTYPFVEILPLFVEANALEYLGYLVPEYREDVYTYKKSTLLTLLNMARKLIYQHDFYAGSYTSNKLLGIISTMLKNHKSYSFSRDALEGSVNEKYMYLISYLVVIELLSCKDFELAKHRLNKIIESNELNNYILFLYDMGINLNEHSSEYIESIRDNKKIIRY